MEEVLRAARTGSLHGLQRLRCDLPVPCDHDAKERKIAVFSPDDWESVDGRSKSASALGRRASAPRIVPMGNRVAVERLQQRVAVVNVTRRLHEPGAGFANGVVPGSARFASERASELKLSPGERSRSMLSI